jgi:hypothetical protein
MAWTWAKRAIEKNISSVVKAPQLYAYGSVFWAFLAGFWLRDVIWRSRNHSATAFDYLNGPLLLLIALLWTYCIAKALKRFQPNSVINFIPEWIEDFQHQRSSMPVLLRSLDSILYRKPSLSPELRAVVLEAANDLKATQNAVGADARQVPEVIVGRLKSVLEKSRFHSLTRDRSTGAPIC